MAAGTALAVVRSSAQQPAAAQQPFRSGVDIIRIDASVLDKDRRPVRGLTAEDFTVLENGKPQRIVAVDEIDTVANDPAPTAWMRYATRDVAGNDLTDQLVDSQAVAIVMDDEHIPFDDSDIVVATRNAARYIVDTLAPSDLAAVVFPVHSGLTQDFTTERTKLLDAIDRFRPDVPDELRDRYRMQPAAGGLEGDIQRYSPIIGRDPCLQNAPLLPTLRAITARLSVVPNQRKTVILLSTGSPEQFAMGQSRCQGLKYDEMRATFRQAQRYNVNIHAVDPAGYRGMERFFTEPHVRNGRMQMPADTFQAHQMALRLRDYLKLNAEQTGGRAVVDSMDIEADLDQIFAENALYYLIGYESSNGAPDGKFRRLEVKVRNRDLTVRTKNGYWSEDKDDPNQRKDAAAASDLRLTGLSSPTGLPLRAALHPIALLPNGDVDVAAVLTVRVPAPRATATEALTLIRTPIDLDGRAGPPVQTRLSRTVEPSAGDHVRYDVLAHFPLAPGRYEVRFNATSALANSSGSVYAELEVPDLRKAPLSAPGIVLGYAGDEPRKDDLVRVLPVAPTTSRDFTRGERVRAVMRLFQGSDAPPAPVEITARILGADNVEPLVLTSTVAADVFTATRTADYTLDLPFDRLDPGLHLLSVTAMLQGRTVRHDVVFRLR